MIDYPGNLDSTRLWGINDCGQIVGSFLDATGMGHGFLATPAPVPEPPSSLTLAAGLVGLFAMVWCRKRARGC
jgi:hypothetical protein